MNNKKLSRLLEPNLQLYFVCLLLFSLAAVTVSPLLALVEGTGGGPQDSDATRTSDAAGVPSGV